MCLVLRSWHRAGIIENLDPLLRLIQEEEELLKVLKMSDEEAEAYVTSRIHN
jgi:hypothetical protein